MSILVLGKGWFQSEICVRLLYSVNLWNITKCPTLGAFWGFNRKIRKAIPSWVCYRGSFTG